MSLKQQRLIIVLILAVIIAGISFYVSGQVNQRDATDNLIPKVATAGTGSEMAVVYVSGGVNKPGVIQVPVTSRALDVVNAAGGLAANADAAKINLAQPVIDGMHIQVPVVASNDSVVNSAAVPGKVSINRASKQELDRLPGIGPALAQRIIDYRQTNGEFKVLTDLKKVSGIGDAKFKQLQDQISL